MRPSSDSGDFGASHHTNPTTCALLVDVEKRCDADLLFKLEAIELPEDSDGMD